MFGAFTSRFAAPLPSIPVGILEDSLGLGERVGRWDPVGILCRFLGVSQQRLPRIRVGIHAFCCVPEFAHQIRGQGAARVAHSATGARSVDRELGPVRLDGVFAVAFKLRLVAALFLFLENGECVGRDDVVGGDGVRGFGSPFFGGAAEQGAVVRGVRVEEDFDATGGCKDTNKLSNWL